MIRVVLPLHLRNLAKISGEVDLIVESPVTTAAVINAIEREYPALRGTIRHHVTNERRPFIRIFACNEDISLESLDTVLPEAIADGVEPLLIVGAIAGG